MGFLDSAGLARFFERLKPRLVRGMTQAAYDALPEAERGRGLYVITDAAGDGGAGGSGGVKMASGSYVGDGDFGRNNVINIGFQPKFFVCTESDTPFVMSPIEGNAQAPNDYLFWMDGMEKYITIGKTSGESMIVPIHALENGIEIGGFTRVAERVDMSYSARACLNAAGRTYVWFAIG